MTQRQGQWKTILGTLGVALLVLVARQGLAFASPVAERPIVEQVVPGAHGAPAAHGGAAAEHGAAAQHGAAAGHGGHDAVPSEDHWSIFQQFFPAGVENLRAAWGKTWITKQEKPSRTLHFIIGVLVFVLALGLASVSARKFAKKGDDAVLPERTFGWFTIFEMTGEWIYKTMIDIMGAKQARFFFPLIFALGTFILFSNLIGMVPGLVGATDNLNTTLPLALTVFFATHIYGVKEQGFGNYFGHFFGPMRGLVWAPLMILMFLIEIVSHLARPASLAIRLMGNMFGDHQVLGIFLGFGLLLVPLPIMVLGTLVCVVQTLVFCLLSIVYIALAVQHSDHGSHSEAH